MVPTCRYLVDHGEGTENVIDTGRGVRAMTTNGLRFTNFTPSGSPTPARLPVRVKWTALSTPLSPTLGGAIKPPLQLLSYNGLLPSALVWDI